MGVSGSDRYTERRLGVWTRFRKRKTIVLTHEDLWIEGLQVSLLKIRDLSASYHRWYNRLFSIGRVVVTYRYQKQQQTLTFLTSDVQARTLSERLRANVTVSFEKFVPEFIRKLDSVERDQATVFCEQRYLRHSHAEQFAARYDVNFKDLAAQVRFCAKQNAVSEELALRFGGLKARVQRLEPYINEWQTSRDAHNQGYIRRYALQDSAYFANVESSSLTSHQIEAALVFDDANLVTAAAGSGKSSCIVAKIGFALKQGLFQDREILALAYNKLAAAELQARLNKKLPVALGRPIKVASRTFHSFGLSVLLEHHGEGYRPNVFKEDEGEEGRLMKTVIDQLYEDDVSFKANITQWMLQAPYDDPRPQGGGDDLEECEQRYEACCAQRVRAAKKKFEPSVPTFDLNKPVRSLQERSIANWLILHGVRFNYEEADWEGGKRLKLRPKSPASKKPPPCRPDFTYWLPAEESSPQKAAVRIVHEHFALNAQGVAPQWMGGDKYAQQAAQKREMYNQRAQEHASVGSQKIRFFETTSADFYDGSIFDKLRQALIDAGVPIQAPDPVIEAKALAGFRQNNELEELIKNFVLSFKDSGLSPQQVEQQAESMDNPHRAKLFLKVAFAVFDGYQAALKTAGKIDFADMLRNAVELLKNGTVKTSYRFVLVDEFQDISLLKANLVKSILDQATDRSIVFGVGDDWQTINRFSGSDVSIFTDMERYFSRYVTRVVLPDTFRCSQGIADVSRAVVLRNEGQVDKPVRSSNSKRQAAVRVVEHGIEAQDRRVALVSELERLVVQAPNIKLTANDTRPGLPSVLILRRTKSPATTPEGLDDAFLEDLRGRYDTTLTIEVMTTHGSKGLEADFVVLAGLDSGFRGFPDERPPEPLLDLVLPPRKDPIEEERRLFYVGLTRARHQVCVLTASPKPSQFLFELQDQKGAGGAIDWVAHSEQRVPCPRCTVGSLLKRNNTQKCTRSSLCGYQRRVA